MAWTFEQATGFLFKPDGKLHCMAYAGKGAGKNNPAMQYVHNVGPLPQGKYTFSAPVNTATHGPCVLWLTPDPSTVLKGRSAFGIHADSLHSPGQASEGCVITLGVKGANSTPLRQAMWASGDHVLMVISGHVAIPT